ncbi:MAG: family 10 glycosylhydrolase [Verrucomicrobiae bacterium]|nr:family 10 glycosylhydrolase [Verrucomicrobiae bacterium]
MRALTTAVTLLLYVTVVIADDAVIDSCKYPDDASAQAAWQPMRGTAPVTVAKVAGRRALRMPCNFAGTTIERASWDRKVQLDLVSCEGIQFKVLCKNTAPVSGFTIYFESDGGWYSAAFHPESQGWNTVTINKAGTRSEGKPAGWGRIKTIRISAWRAQDVNTEFYITDLVKTGVLGADSLIAVVRGESATRARPDEARSVDQFAENVIDHLRALGIGCAVISDLDATAERLKPAKLVILPHNPSMPDNVADELVRFAQNGGKLLGFYSLPAKLRPVLKLDQGQHVRAARPGHFAAIRFADNALPGAPQVVGQRSWNINDTKPAAGARVLAEWLDDAGQPTGYAAVLASDNGIWMTHVLLDDDPVNKQRMLMAMVGQLVPDLWRQTAEAAAARIGQIADYKTYDKAAADIARMGRGDKRVTSALASARQLREAAQALCKQGRFTEVAEKAATANQKLREAYCMAQKPLKGEFRAFWCHSAFGVEGMTWDEAIKNLADNGFTAIFPNMLWGGVAFYPSKVLPVAPDVSEKGDQIAQCVAACKKYGVEIHVWKVNWNTGWRAPKEFIERMRRENRLQASSKGKEEPWLCPSHPENQKLEIASMVEVARDYDVDGIHFDYIRYPNNDHCFCNGCRERFAQATGARVPNWPKDVLNDGPLRQQWLNWRRGNITAVVKATSEQARAIKPRIKISAAVFRNWPTDRDSVGQDWKLWCDNGWLDLVCPMDYTESNTKFENFVASQKRWAGRVPLRPGIGASASRSHLTPEQVIQQIHITRRHDTKGFIIFNYGVPQAKELVPMLGLGITAKR